MGRGRAGRGARGAPRCPARTGQPQAPPDEQWPAPSLGGGIASILRRQHLETNRARVCSGRPAVDVECDRLTRKGVVDALEVKCREGGRTVNACVVHAVAVNRGGYRESLGLDVVTSEDGAAWLAFLRSLVARGLAGVCLVTSDAHPGLVDAIAATLPGASWQR